MTVSAAFVCVCSALVVLPEATIVPFWTNAKPPAPPAKCPGGNASGTLGLCAPAPARYDGTQILIDVSVGGQQQRVQFDTGSSDLAMFSKDCEVLGYKKWCGKHALNSYDAHKTGKMLKCNTSACAGRQTKCYQSKYNPFSSLNKGCQYDNYYGDGSGFSAIVFKDTFGIWGDAATTPIHVGAIVAQHGGPGQESFEPFVSDGIFGTGFMTISSSDPGAKYNPAVTLAKSQGKPGLFSMCFSKGGGAFGIGEVVPYHDGVFVAEPVVPQRTVPGGKHGYWSVYVKDVRVFGKSLAVPSVYYNHNECIVDSGTTVFMLPTPAFEALAFAVFSDCRWNKLVGVCVDDAGAPVSPQDGNSIFNGAPFKLSPTEIAAYPNVDIVMQKATVSVPPSSYISCFEDQGGSCFMMIQPGEMTMLGDGMMAGFTTVFDQDNMEIRFAKVKDCPAPASLAAAVSAPSSSIIV